MLFPNKQCCNRKSLSHAVTEARMIPIVREEDFAGPALTNTIQQLLSQVQSRLVGILWEDDMPVSACRICHAAHQFWLQLCTHALNKHAHLSLSSTLSDASAWTPLVYLLCQLGATLLVVLLQTGSAGVFGGTCGCNWELCVGIRLHGAAGMQHSMQHFTGRKCCRDASLCLSLASIC